MAELEYRKKIEILTAMGDFLDALDNVRERNEYGFNRIDKSLWPRVRGKDSMCKVLQKYHRQLIPVFGEDSFSDATSAVPEEATTTISIQVEQGMAVFRLQGARIPRERFEAFRDVQQRHGLRYHRDLGCCVLIKSQFNDFNLDQFKLDVIEFDIVVEGEVPKLDAPMTPDDAWEALDQKVEKIFCLRYEDGKFKFRFSFSQDLNQLFSNKGGNLSGIFEVVPDIWTRETLSLDLAKEALAKAKKILPKDWVCACIDLSTFERDLAERLRGEQEPIPDVVAKLSPDFSLFPFQNEFVRFLTRNEGSALIGAEMGLGKTLISLSWCAANNKRVLVVCPKVVRRTWVKEAEKFFPEYFNKGIELRPNTLKKSGQPDLRQYNIASVNFSSFEKFLPAIKDAGFDTLIIDESHYIKNENAKITRLIFSVQKLFAHKILLSGTAIKNKKSELFTQAQLVRPGVFESKLKLRDATIGGTWNKMQDFYMTKSKEEVLKDLPAKMRSIIDVSVPDCPDIDMGTTIGDLSRLKADVAKAKAETTVDFVKEILETSDSAVLVFTDSVEAAHEITQLLGNDALLHHGQMSDDAREAVKADFQEGETEARVFVSTRQSLAVGATLTRADKIVFNDLPWTPSDIRQAEDRAHRIGQEKMVNVYWLKVSDNEWDSNIIDIIARKFEISKKILEGKQVSPEDRAWMEKPVSLSEVLEKIQRKIKRENKKALKENKNGSDHVISKKRPK